MANTQEHTTWGELLHSAVHTPGKLLAAYSASHNYSFGNGLLALEQCISRKIVPGPLNSHRGWVAPSTKGFLRAHTYSLAFQEGKQIGVDLVRVGVGIPCGKPL